MTASCQPLWYAVHTRPREEQKALAHLRRQSYHAYLPMIDRKVRHARRNERVLRPFFRAVYLSRSICPPRGHPIRSTPGVADSVCFGDHPAALPDGVVEEMKRREDDNGGIEVLQPTASSAATRSSSATDRFRTSWGCAGRSPKASG